MASSQIRWYETERNTAALLKAVVSEIGAAEFSGESIGLLLQLTWITRSQDHWRTLKVPILGQLFDKRANVQRDLHVALEAMQLKTMVAAAASTKTGFVNLRNPYRKSALKWCVENADALRRILSLATTMGSNDQIRFDLAAQIRDLPLIPTPSGKSPMRVENLLTPMIACLDPQRRFPVINGQKKVQTMLAAFGLARRDLADQVKGLVNLIGQFGIDDAFRLDTLSENQIKQIAKKLKRSLPEFGKTNKKQDDVRAEDALLRKFDESERESANKAQTIIYRKRHNKMTNRLRALLASLTVTQGSHPDCRYDALVHDYDGKGRDLLIEVKPDADKGSLRIAVGQLLDYRRFLPQQAGTDIAVLTILAPEDKYVEFLQGLQITALWFSDEDCARLGGAGKAWQSLKPSCLKRDKGWR